MIIRGGARKDGLHLADYLTTRAANENDRVTILEVRNGTTQDIRKALFDMDISAELTRRGDKGLYHAQINPAYHEDRKMTSQDWHFAVDTLEEELGYKGQNRVIVLHEKKGRIHAHVAWQREKDGKLIGTSLNYKKHDAAREKIEIALEQRRTLQPKDIKQALTALWNNSIDGKDFVTKAEAMGFKIGRGDKRAYTVRTPDGQKLDFVRQLQKVKTHEVKAKFKDIEARLPAEKDLAGQEPVKDRFKQKYQRVKEAYKNSAANNNEKVAGQVKKDIPENQQKPITPEAKKLTVAQLFAAERGDITQKDEKAIQEPEKQDSGAKLIASGSEQKQEPKEAKDLDKKQAVVRLFAESRQETMKPETEQERIQRERRARLEQLNEPAPAKDKANELDKKQAIASLYADSRKDMFDNKSEEEKAQQERLERLQKLNEIDHIKQKEKEKGFGMG